MSDKAVVLHSGGQDSTTCLVWAIHLWGQENVFPVLIDYNQRHGQEIIQAQLICEKLLGRGPQIFLLDVLAQLGGAALTDPDIDVNLDATGTGNEFAEAHGLPSTFVPGRNMLLFTIAAAYGAQLGIYNIVTGVCETDRAGYPDCRSEFVAAAQNALQVALGEPAVTIHAPLIRLDKAHTFQLADNLDALELVLEMTSTCYHGTRQERHTWGYGCGECPACIERMRGWQEFVEELREPAEV